LEKCDTLLIAGSSFRTGLSVGVGLVGDGGQVLEKLLSMLDRQENRDYLSDAHEAAELGRRLSATAIISLDSGSNTLWRARQTFSCSGNLAPMACALPYTIAA